jgi:hypothetical protein
MACIRAFIALSELAACAASSADAQFTDKEDCFLTIYDEQMGRLQAVTRDAFDAQDEWVPALRAGVTALPVAASGRAMDYSAVASLPSNSATTASPRSTVSKPAPSCSARARYAAS